MTPLLELPTVLFVILILLVFDLVNILIAAACTMTIWNWYIPMIFTDAPTLTMGTAFGLSCVISILTLRHSKHDTEDMGPGEVLAYGFSISMEMAFKMVFVLIVAAIGHSIIV